MSYATPLTAGELTPGHPATRTRIRDLGVYIEPEPAETFSDRAHWLITNQFHPAVAAGVVQTPAELDAFEANAKTIGLAGIGLHIDPVNTLLSLMRRGWVL